MSPNAEGKDRLPSGSLLSEIKQEFGGYEQFKSAFTDKAKTLFGSGTVKH